MESKKPQVTIPPDVFDRIARLIWEITWLLLARFSPTPLHAWRRMLLRAFGAKIGKGAVIYSSAKVWKPWNLVMETGSCLGREANCYNVAQVILKRDCVVSQRAYLCSAGHDVHDPTFPLVSAPITIGQDAWVAAGAFVGPGVILDTGAVAAARAVVVKSVPAWSIVGGNPAVEIGKRSIKRPL